CHDIQMVFKNVPRLNDAFSLKNPEHLVTLGTPGDAPCPAATGPEDELPYHQIIARVRQTVETQVPTGARVLVVSKGDNQLMRFDGREGWHFLRAPNGVFAGYNPADSNEAISHLESLRAQGAQYLVLPQTAFWWLDFYTGFHSYIDARYSRIWSDEACIVYKLSPRPGQSPP